MSGHVNTGRQRRYFRKKPGRTPRPQSQTCCTRNDRRSRRTSLKTSTRWQRVQVAYANSSFSTRPRQRHRVALPPLSTSENQPAGCNQPARARQLLRLQAMRARVARPQERRRACHRGGDGRSAESAGSVRVLIEARPARDASRAWHGSSSRCTPRHRP